MSERPHLRLTPSQRYLLAVIRSFGRHRTRDPAAGATTARPPSRPAAVSTQRQRSIALRRAG